MSKNTHLEHLEDSILLDGINGANDAFKFLDLLAKTFSGNSSNNFKITTKWDGAPAIFCGIYPGTTKFFVGTKSVFNKDAKINFTDADIDANHGHAPGLVSKLKEALKYFPALGITGVAQGDLLFTDDKKIQIIDGKNSITFQPNTITYSIPEDNELYAKAKRAKIGVVFHTSYKGRDISSMNASFGYDISKLKKTDDVLVLSAETSQLGKDTLLTDADKIALSRMKKQSPLHLRRAGSFLNEVASQIVKKDQLTVGPRLKIFFNTYVRQGKPIPTAAEFYKEFSEYFIDACQKAVDKVTTPKAKSAKKKKMYEGLDFIEENKSALYSTVELYKILQEAKLVFIRKLEKGEKIKTYLKTETGYEVTAPEGYVAVSGGVNAVKLVDRLSFSVANFNVSKDWVSGDK
jgi:uncharacterized protein YjgD (DUF1641 family)